MENQGSKCPSVFYKGTEEVGGGVRMRARVRFRGSPPTVPSSNMSLETAVSIGLRSRHQAVSVSGDKQSSRL